MTTVTFSGKSEAKGRNGYFHMAGAQATRLNMPNDTPYHISLYSSRPAPPSPIYMMMTKDDLIVLRTLVNSLISEDTNDVPRSEVTL